MRAVPWGHLRLQHVELRILYPWKVRANRGHRGLHRLCRRVCNRGGDRGDELLCVRGWQTGKATVSGLHRVRQGKSFPTSLRELHQMSCRILCRRRWNGFLRSVRPGSSFGVIGRPVILFPLLSWLRTKSNGPGVMQTLRTRKLFVGRRIHHLPLLRRRTLFKCDGSGGLHGLRARSITGFHGTGSLLTMPSWRSPSFNGVDHVRRVFRWQVPGDDWERLLHCVRAGQG